MLEAGTGAAAALLCLGARVPGVHATGVEIDTKMAELAAANVDANSLAGINIIAGPIETATFAHPFDHSPRPAARRPNEPSSVGSLR